MLNIGPHHPPHYPATTTRADTFSGVLLSPNTNDDARPRDLRGDLHDATRHPLGALLLGLLLFAGLASEANASPYQPTASVGADQYVYGGDTVTLDGSDSFDSHGGTNTETYLWNQISGPPVNLNNATHNRATFVAPRVSTVGQPDRFSYRLEFVLQVNDSSGEDYDGVTITVTSADAVNNPPTADAGEDQTVDRNIAVTLNGSASSDPEGDTLTYRWRQPSGRHASLSGNTTATPTFTAPPWWTSEEVLVFHLTVTDSGGHTDTDTVTITVTPALNNSPTADAGQDITVDPGASVTLNGNASSDPDGDALTYRWWQTSGWWQTRWQTGEFWRTGINLNGDNSANPVFTAPLPLTDVDLVFRLVVTDPSGLTATDSVTITVTPASNDPPIADAGEDQTAAPGASVTLNGSASIDPNGDALTYRWSQIGGERIDWNYSDSATPTFTVPLLPTDAELTDADLVFHLTVIASNGDRDTDTVTIKVIFANTPPIADASQDITVDPGATVTLNGNASSDPEGDALTYSWWQISGFHPTAGGVSMADSASAHPVFIVPLSLTDIDLVFRLRVTDSGGRTDTDSVTVTVTPAVNNPPIADAGGNQTVNEGTDVTLNGSSSSDPEGGTLTYSWTQAAEPEDVTLGGNTTPTLTFTAPWFPTNTDMVFELTVTDSGGLTDTDTVTITVHANQPPIADAGEDQTVGEGAAVTLNGNASSDPEGDALTYSWTQTAGPNVIVGGNTTATPTFTAPWLQADADLVFELTVTDSNGHNHTDTDTVTITVVGADDATPVGNQPPTADAGEDQTVDGGATVTLNGNASSDPEGDALTYSWWQISGFHSSAVWGMGVHMHEHTSAHPSFTVPLSLTDIDLVFRLRVTDSGGRTDTDSVTVTVTDAINNPPIADAGEDITVDPGATVTLNASASSDPDGGALTYRWHQRTGYNQHGLGVRVRKYASAHPVFTIPTSLRDFDLVFNLTVTDSGGRTDSDTVTITVTDFVNVPPIADAGDNQTVDEGASVTLNASASSHPQSKGLDYSWTQTAGADVILDDSTTATISTFTAPWLQADTDLVFDLTVTDSFGLSDTDTVTITVIAADDATPVGNQPPVIIVTGNNVGPNLWTFQDEIVSLDASSSYDPEGGPLTFLWRSLDAEWYGWTDLPTISDITSATPTFDLRGLNSWNGRRYDYELVVADEHGATSRSRRAIHITPITLAIVPDAGPDRTVDEGEVVTLDPSGSQVPLRFGPLRRTTWELIDTSGQVVHLTQSVTMSREWQIGHFTAPTGLSEDIEITLGLRIESKFPNDWGSDSSALDTVTYTVRAANDPPIADAGEDQTVDGGATVTLNGNASSDPEGNALIYSWTQTAGANVTVDDSTAANPVFTAPLLLPGIDLVFDLTVTDAGGLTDTDTVTITVIAINAPPIADAGEDQTVDGGATVTLNGNASSDPEGDALIYSWTQTAGVNVALNDSTTANPVFTAPQLLPGIDLVFDLTVTDSVGLTDTDTVTITAIPVANDAPIANAGEDQTVAPDASVTLNGSASSDPDGDALSYQWAQLHDNLFVHWNGYTGATPTFTPPWWWTSDAVLVFRLTVTDPGGLTDIDTVTITVTAANVAPVADAGTTQTVDEGATVTLNGNASSDPEDGTLTHSWTQTAGPDVTVDDNTIATPTFTAPQLLTDTDLVFSLTVTDSGGLTDTDTVTITVNAANVAPVADAGPTQTVDEGATVTLNGNASSDPEDETLDYSWAQTAGPDVTVGGNTTATPTFTAPQLLTDTDLVFSLTVTDSGGLTDTDTVTITVNAANVAPIADAGEDQTVDEGATVTLNGNASSDPEGETLTHSWTQTAGPDVTFDDNTTATSTFTAPQLLTDTDLVFSLTVTDSVGLTDTDTVTITVVAINAPPIANAGEDQTVDNGATVTLNGGASSDPDGDVLSYQWAQPHDGGGMLSHSYFMFSPAIAGKAYSLFVHWNGYTTATPTFTPPWWWTSDAVLVFRLTVTDSGGLTDTDTVTITVRANPPPVADAGQTQTVAEGATVTLNGNASSDPEGETLTHSWTQTAGPDVTLDDNTTATSTFTAPHLLTDTDLVFSLTVTDPGGLTDTDTVTITVTAANVAPIADAGEDQTVDEGATVTLNGNASSDPEDETLTHSWTQTAGPDVTVDDNTTATSTFTAPHLLTDTDLVFSLTVTDSGGLTDTDTVTITVTAANIAPVADAGEDITVDEGATVTLNGNASSDPEDETLTYSWTQSAGPDVTVNGNTTATPTFTAPKPLPVNTDFVFGLTVTDSGGLTDTDTVTITVRTNQPPVADAGEDITATSGDRISLDASGSSDPEGGQLKYWWTLHLTNLWPRDGGDILTAWESATPTFTVPPVANLPVEDRRMTFGLWVIDDHRRLSTFDTVTVFVIPAPAPTADAGPTQTVDEGATVTLNGNASSDPNGNALTYSWTQTTGPNVALNGNTTATPTFTAPQLSGGADLVFNLTVTNPGWSTDTDTVTITVNAANVAPVADAGEDITVAEGATVTLNGNASSDPEDETLTYSWTQSAGPDVTVNGNTTATPTFTAPKPLPVNTDFVFDLTVTDSGGLTDTDTVTITVRTNQPPVADAGEDITATSGDRISLDASGSSDPEGGPLKYWWTLHLTNLWPRDGGDILTSWESATPTFTVPPVADLPVEDRRMTFGLWVIDDHRRLSTFDTVTVFVVPAPAPTADAGPTQTVDEGATVTLNGNASSDPNGNALTYSWTQTTGPNVALNGNTTATPTFTAPQLSADTDLVFNLTVTNSGWSTDTDTVTITVNAANVAPIADAGPTQTVDEGATVTLNGNASSDPEGNALAYSWTQTTGPNVALNGNTTATPTFTAPQLLTDTDLVFGLTVTDSGELTDTDTVTITVTAANVAPIANAGPTQIVDEGATVTLNGNASSDPEGNALTYSWAQTAGPDVIVDDNTIATPTFTAPQLLTDTDLVFGLTVTDSGELTDTDTVTITVTAINDAPVADAGEDITATSGERISLNGNASSDPEGDALTYSWTQTTGPQVNLRRADRHRAIFSAPKNLVADTELMFSLTVTDSSGNSDTDTTTITVTAVNAPPIADAGEDQSAASGERIVLSGTASSDPDGDALAYSWTQTAGPQVNVRRADRRRANFTTPQQLPTDTELVFSLTVTDARGLVSVSADTVTITVTAAPNNPPIADAGATQTVNEGGRVTLDGNGSSDPENQTLAYAWTQNEGVVVSVENADTATPTFTAPSGLASCAPRKPEDCRRPTFTDSNGVEHFALAFQLTVTDPRGDSDTDTVIIAVRASNLAPVADAGNAQSVPEGATVTLNGNGSSDPESQTLTYAWAQTGGANVVLSGNTTATPTFTAPQQLLADAELVFNLTVADTRGLDSTDTVTITVTAAPNNPPIANAGAAQTVNEGGRVTLDGNASSDPENQTLTYAWTQNEGVVVSVENADTATPTFTAPSGLASCAPRKPEDCRRPTFTDSNGVEHFALAFQLTVTDPRGDSDTDTVIIAVRATNLAPVADAGNAQSVPEGATVTLNGNGSSDPEGKVLTYAWTQATGANVVLSGNTTATPTFTAPQQLVADAELVFSLTVADTRGLDSTDTVTITVTAAPNNPPIANAGATQTVNEGGRVTLDGNASSDPENQTLAYAWAQNEGVVVSVENADTATPTFTAPSGLASCAPRKPEECRRPTFTDSNGIEHFALAFQLTVTDPRGDSDTDTVIIAVRASNLAPVADAGNAQSVPEGATVTLNGNGSSDPEDQTLTYAWAQTGGANVVLSGNTTATPTFTAPQQLAADAELVFNLTVADTRGLDSTDTVTITVTAAPNNPPVADAGNAQSVPEGAAVTLNGSGSSDPESQTLTYAWTQAAGANVVLNGNTTATPTFTAPQQLLADAELVFSLTVADTRGLDSTDTVTITVTAAPKVAPNAAPIANAGAAQIVDEGVRVTLNGNGSSDPEGRPLTYSWTQADGVTVTVENADTATPTFNVSVGFASCASGNAGNCRRPNSTGPEGTAYFELVFELIVTDPGGRTGTDTVTITVRTANFDPGGGTLVPFLIEAAQTIMDDTGTAITQRVEQALSANRTASVTIGGQSSLAGALNTHGEAMSEGGRDVKELLAGSNFVLPMNSGNQAALWGSGEYRNLSGEGNISNGNGELVGAQVGFDARIRNDLLMGVAVSWSQGMNYQNDTSGVSGNGYEIDLTSTHPYIGWKIGQLDLWATTGYGEGTVNITQNKLTRSSDINLQTIGMGGSGQVWESGATQMRLKGETVWSQLEIEGSADLNPLAVDARRMRLSLETTHKINLQSGGLFAPSLAVGMRHDGGDGETGTGTEIDGGLRYENPGSRVTLEGRIRTLFGYGGDHDEWGVESHLQFLPGADGQGWSFGLRSAYGDSSGGVEPFGEHRVPGDVSDTDDYHAQLDTRIGHGFSLRDRDGVLTPYSEMTLGSIDSHRLGMNWKSGSRYDFSLLGERRKGDTNPLEHIILLKGEVRF